MKEDEIGIGITDAGSLSLKAGEGAGVYTTKYKRVVEKTRHPPIFDLSLLVPPKYDVPSRILERATGSLLDSASQSFSRRPLRVPATSTTRISGGLEPARVSHQLIWSATFSIASTKAWLLNTWGRGPR